MKKIWERIVSISKADRGWDVRFWQAQSPEVRFRVAWNMLKLPYKKRGQKLSGRTFRLQRSVEKFKQAWKHKTIARFAGVKVNIIGMGELLQSKRKTKREDDILDIKKLTRKKS